jgi:hypothetical protein
MRDHLDHFLGSPCAELSEPARRFVGEALYGIAAHQSVRPTEIGRAQEEPIASSWSAKRESVTSAGASAPPVHATHLWMAYARRKTR